MLYEAKVTNPAGDSLTMKLTEPEASGICILNIDGLGPVKAIINLKENSQNDGGEFGNAKISYRNVVFNLTFLPFQTIEETRLRTYQMFPIKGFVTLEFLTDAGRFYITGYVESNEPTIFAKEQGTSISIICPYPFFKYTNDLGKTSDTASQITSMFSFPFENEGASPALVFGTKDNTTSFDLVLGGNVNVSPTITLFVDGGQVNNPTLNFENDRVSTGAETFSIEFTSTLEPLENGDYLKIVCQPGNKSVTRYKASTGSFINYLGAVKANSTWPVLKPGINTFSYSADSGIDFLSFAYEYESLFNGI